MQTHDRLHALDAVRGFALLLGIVFHAGFSFIPGMIPGLWAIVDVRPSVTIAVVLFTSHIFRMSLFFFLAGFFGRLTFHRKGARAFWRDRLKRILVPLVVGWAILFPSIAVVWIWGLTRTFGGEVPAAPAGMPPPPPGAFPLTHLWFLYVLLVLYALMVAARTALAAFDRQGTLRRHVDAAVERTVSSGTAVALLPLPLAFAFGLRPGWIQWFGIPTPDQSLIPQATSLVAFGTAFSFGWLVQRQPGLLQAWQRMWAPHLAAAILASVGCLFIAGATPTFAPAVPGLKTWSYALLYSVAIWAWVFAITGLALRFLSGESAVRRYVADSAYWLYLVHLPIVVALQVLVGHLAWPWLIKFPLVLVVSLAILFASYHLLVRFTFVGALLNGRRHVRRAARPSVSSEGPAEHSADSSLAVLDGVHRRS